MKTVKSMTYTVLRRGVHVTRVELDAKAFLRAQEEKRDIEAEIRGIYDADELRLVSVMQIDDTGFEYHQAMGDFPCVSC